MRVYVAFLTDLAYAMVANAIRGLLDRKTTRREENIYDTMLQRERAYDRKQKQGKNDNKEKGKKKVTNNEKQMPERIDR